MNLKKLGVLSALLFCFQTEAKIEVLFHPQEPTLEKIAEWISSAHSTVDIAMYSMDTGPNSQIIQVLKSPNVQDRIKTGELRIRLIYEGYGSPEEKEEKMEALEDLGVDARYLGKSAKVHHKFAVIDSQLDNNRLISGSANWSMTSYKNYNENILFSEGEKELAIEFQAEFDRLWKASKQFGEEDPIGPVHQPNIKMDDPEIQVLFNSGRFLSKKPVPVEITQHLVELIDQAQKEILIATTRIRRTAILQAIARATARGVKVRLIINQDDYADIDKRADPLLTNPNVKTRIKFYNLKLADFLMFQMHNKFMIVDGKTLFTGSFNWSDSAEYGHIENVIVLSGAKAAEVLPRYHSEFEKLWLLGRGQFFPLLQSLKRHEVTKCPIAPMTISARQITVLLNAASHCKGSRGSSPKVASEL